MRFASAMPAAMLSPWPREPVAARTNGIFGVGWPSSILVNLRRFFRSSFIIPASAKAAYKIGAAWPFERTK